MLDMAAAFVGFGVPPFRDLLAGIQFEVFSEITSSHDRFLASF
jgi:hypothetical protein